MSAIQVPHAFHMECMNHFTLRTLGPVTFAHSMMGHHLPTLTFPETPSISSTLRSWHRTPSVTQTRSPPTHMPQKRMELLSWGLLHHHSEDPFAVSCFRSLASWIPCYSLPWSFLSFWRSVLLLVSWESKGLLVLGIISLRILKALLHFFLSSRVPVEKSYAFWFWPFG